MPVKTVWVTKTGATAKTHPVPGYKALYHPLLIVEPPDSMPVPPCAHDILVFTSSNGVEHFCALTDRRDWQVFTVGDATAGCAKKMGFTYIQSAGKDVKSLISLISETVPKNASLYYASAAEISGALAGDLERAGYNIKRAVFYQTLVNTVIFDKPADFILLYSQKGAKALSLSEQTQANSTIISISEPVDSALGNRAAKLRKWPKTPNHKSMLKLLDRP